MVWGPLKKLWRSGMFMKDVSMAAAFIALYGSRSK